MQKETNKSSKEKKNVRQLICFELAGEEYAIGIEDVLEVLRAKKIVYIPQMPAYCMGILYNRGHIMPVFDLREKFSLYKKPIDDESRFIVASVDQVSICLIVDKVIGSIALEASRVGPAPSVTVNIDREYLEGLGYFEERVIVVLDVKKMHAFIMNDLENLKVKGVGLCPAD
jgi:purine-binding chemotaxis protein CheW